jgi:hypothetical protein
MDKMVILDEEEDEDLLIRLKGQVLLETESPTFVENNILKESPRIRKGTILNRSSSAFNSPTLTRNKPIDNDTLNKSLFLTLQ